MLATDGPLPADLSGWAAEVKWDGMRLVCSVDRQGAVRAWARSGSDATARYPELAPLAALREQAPLVLDGEAVVLDQTGRPSFGLLQQRMTLSTAARIRAAVARVPVTVMVFDVLVHRGEQVTGRPYRERRELLESLGLPLQAVHLPPVWRDDPAAGIAWAREHRLEGVILKRLDAPYRPGARSADWLKVKFRPTADVLIGGWLADDTGRPRSLLVGTGSEGGGLRYIGAVGSGLSRAQVAMLTPLLAQAAADTPPFTEGLPPRLPEGVRWVHPLLRGEVEYSEITSGGTLRQTAWKGLRGVVGE
jgi:bifunctional non-homologous end joining protein LigD